MKIPAFLAIAMAMSASAFSQTAPPAAPTLTAGAEFKGLRLDWDTVPGATWYQVEYRAHQTGDFVQQGDDYPATSTSTRFTFPLHLYDWTYARYRLAACNSAGCTRSEEVSVSSLRKDAVGYFKASPSYDFGSLGASTDLTPDGYTLVATAPNEQSDFSATSKGRIHVFRRGADGRWVRRARLDARTDTTYNSYVELYASVSASGNTVVVTMPAQIVGQPANHTGEVDIYYWKNNAYTPTRFPRAPFDVIRSAEIDDSGYVLAVHGAIGADGLTRIYKSTNSVWVNVASIPDESCWNVRLTQDAKKLAAVCRGTAANGAVRDYVRVLSGSTWSTRQEIELDNPDLSDSHTAHYHTGFGLDRTGATIAVQTRDDGYFDTSSNVRVFRLNGAAYSLVTQLRAGDWNPSDNTGEYGDSVSISGDGLTLVVGHPEDYGKGLGPRAAPLLAGDTATGGVYVYRLTSSWKLANVVKPNYVGSPTAFGQVTALSGTGKTLVVGVPGEDSMALGIGGDWANSGRANSGALFMY
jgi:hypothetical protein